MQAGGRAGCEGITFLRFIVGMIILHQQITASEVVLEGSRNQSYRNRDAVKLLTKHHDKDTNNLIHLSI